MEDAASILRELNRVADFTSTEHDLTPSVLETAAGALMSAFDDRNGGFGAAPKFPPSMHCLSCCVSIAGVERGALSMPWS